MSQAASMVPEYLTPTNGGLLSPGQLVALSRAVLGRYGGPGVAELVLEITPDVMVGKVSMLAVHVMHKLVICGHIFFRGLGFGTRGVMVGKVSMLAPTFMR
jgi:hypothetical protein